MILTLPVVGGKASWRYDNAQTLEKALFSDLNLTKSQN